MLPGRIRVSCVHAKTNPSMGPKARVIWAHTGFTTPLSRVTELLDKYPELRGELSYRWDVAEEGKLMPAWRARIA